MMKRLLSLLLTLCVLCAALPAFGEALPSEALAPQEAASETTEAPTIAPTEAPATAAPITAPTEAATDAPTADAPTTDTPTQSPATDTPTTSPTQSPSADTPTIAPTDAPSTDAPTTAPTEAASDAPPEAASDAPTADPSAAPDLLAEEAPAALGAQAALDESNAFCQAVMALRACFVYAEDGATLTGVNVPYEAAFAAQAELRRQYAAIAAPNEAELAALAELQQDEAALLLAMQQAVAQLERDAAPSADEAADRAALAQSIACVNACLALMANNAGFAASDVSALSERMNAVQIAFDASAITAALAAPSDRGNYRLVLGTYAVTLDLARSEPASEAFSVRLADADGADYELDDADTNVSYHFVTEQTSDPNQRADVLDQVSVVHEKGSDALYLKATGTLIAGTYQGYLCRDDGAHVDFSSQVTLTVKTMTKLPTLTAANKLFTKGADDQRVEIACSVEGFVLTELETNDWFDLTDDRYLTLRNGEMLKAGAYTVYAKGVLPAGNEEYLYAHLPIVVTVTSVQPYAGFAAVTSARSVGAQCELTPTINQSALMGSKAALHADERTIALDDALAQYFTLNDGVLTLQSDVPAGVRQVSGKATIRARLNGSERFLEQTLPLTVNLAGASVKLAKTSVTLDKANALQSLGYELSIPVKSTFPSALAGEQAYRSPLELKDFAATAPDAGGRQADVTAAFSVAYDNTLDRAHAVRLSIADPSALVKGKTAKLTLRFGFIGQDDVIATATLSVKISETAKNALTIARNSGCINTSLSDALELVVTSKLPIAENGVSAALPEGAGFTQSVRRINANTAAIRLAATAENGRYPITITVRDSNGGETVKKLTVTVTNLAPKLSASAKGSMTYPAGSATLTFKLTGKLGMSALDDFRLLSLALTDAAQAKILANADKTGLSEEALAQALQNGLSFDDGALPAKLTRGVALAAQANPLLAALSRAYGSAALPLVYTATVGGRTYTGKASVKVADLSMTVKAADAYLTKAATGVRAPIALSIACKDASLASEWAAGLSQFTPDSRSAATYTLVKVGGQWFIGYKDAAAARAAKATETVTITAVSTLRRANQSIKLKVYNK